MKRNIKVTMEMANERMMETQGKYKFELIEWNGTNHKAKIRCKACGKIIEYAQGSSIYKSPSECSDCRWHSWNRIHAKRYAEQWEELLDTVYYDKEKLLQVEQKMNYYSKEVSNYEERRDLFEEYKRMRESEGTHSNLERIAS